jgi:hypothetical protein
MVKVEGSQCNLRLKKFFVIYLLRLYKNIFFMKL